MPREPTGGYIDLHNCGVLGIGVWVVLGGGGVQEAFLGPKSSATWDEAVGMSCIWDFFLFPDYKVPS